MNRMDDRVTKTVIENQIKSLRIHIDAATQLLDKLSRCGVDASNSKRLSDIARHVCWREEISMARVKARRGTRLVSAIRAEIMGRQYAAGHSMPAIARWWERDPTTVSFNIQKWEREKNEHS